MQKLRMGDSKLYNKLKFLLLFIHLLILTLKASKN